MKTYSEFIQTLKEKVGDFGNPPSPTKVNCYGKVISYPMSIGGKGLPKGKACAFKRKREE